MNRREPEQEQQQHQQHSKKRRKLLKLLRGSTRKIDIKPPQQQLQGMRVTLHLEKA